MRVEELVEHHGGRQASGTVEGARRPRLRLVHGSAGLPAKAGRTASSPGHRRTSSARRGVAALLSLLAAVLVWGVVVAPPRASSHGPAATGPASASEVVVLAPGETLWEVVAPHVPAGVDRHAFIARVLDLNDVDGRVISPGQALRLPAP